MAKFILSIVGLTLICKMGQSVSDESLQRLVHGAKIILCFFIGVIFVCAADMSLAGRAMNRFFDNLLFVLYLICN